jgi:hypothetical protein
VRRRCRFTSQTVMGRAADVFDTVARNRSDAVTIRLAVEEGVPYVLAVPLPPEQRPPDTFRFAEPADHHAARGRHGQVQRPGLKAARTPVGDRRLPHPATARLCCDHDANLAVSAWVSRDLGLSSPGPRSRVLLSRADPSTFPVMPRPMLPTLPGPDDRIDWPRRVTLRCRCAAGGVDSRHRFRRDLVSNPGSAVVEQVRQRLGHGSSAPPTPGDATGHQDSGGLRLAPARPGAGRTRSDGIR